MTMPHLPVRSHGFTLLEVLAAILLLGIAFGLLMRVASSSIRLTAQAGDASEAALWARSKLDSVYVTEPLQLGHSSGRFDQKFQWQLDVTPWDGVGAVPPHVPSRLYELVLEVSWGAPGRARTAHFQTLRLVSGPVEANTASAAPGSAD